MDINTAINNLVAALSASREFSELRSIKAGLSKDPKISQMLNQFLQKQNSLYSSNLSQNQAQGIMNELNADYERLSTVPELKRYFQAVDNFNGLMDKVMKAVNAGMERQIV